MDIGPILNAIRVEERPQVLATIICVEGHSYRKAGASMLLLPDHESIGSISPGCLEADLKERFVSVWESGAAERVEYNMNADEDAIWGESVGCGGRITVLLEAVRGDLRRMLLRLGDMLAEGETVLFERSFRTDKVNYSLSISSSPDVRVPDGCFLYRPQVRVLLFGAGEDSRPIYSRLRAVGFNVVVADWRPGLLTDARFPGAAFIAGTPEEIVMTATLQSRDYVVITSHQLKYDRSILEAVLPLQLEYIGIIGSRRRIAMLFEGMEPAQGSNVHAPIGAAIGAEGPEEIAISIAAELIAVRAGSYTAPSTGGASRENRGNLFGSRREQENGRAQAVAGIVARRNVR